MGFAGNTMGFAGNTKGFAGNTVGFAGNTMGFAGNTVWVFSRNTMGFAGNTVGFYRNTVGMSVCLFSQSVRPGRKADPLEQTERQTNYSKITRDSTKLSKISYK